MPTHVKIIKQIDSMFGHVGEVVREEADDIIVKIKHGYEGTVSEFKFKKGETEPTACPPGGIVAQGKPVQTLSKPASTDAPSSPAPKNFTKDNIPLPTAESINPGHTTEASTINLTAEDAPLVEPKKADEVKGRLTADANKSSEPKASVPDSTPNESSKVSNDKK